MSFQFPERMSPTLLARFARRQFTPTRGDLVTIFMIAGIAVLAVHGAQQMGRPLTALQIAPVTLDPARLPGYALLTVLRMFAALAASLLFTFVVATLAAKSRKAELVIIPALDILQSIPVFGFLTFTVTFFMSLFPGNELGAEGAAIFAVFTAQAWNMAFSFYQSLKTLPADLDEAARGFGLSPWRRFWRLELPFATPALVWNTMMSMSGAWFFVVSSEAITVGNTTVTLPGIGSWLALAGERGDTRAVVWAVATMAVVIFLYDQLLFRPIVAWADKFRFEQTASQDPPKSWFFELLKRMRLIPRLFRPVSRTLTNLPPLPGIRIQPPPPFHPRISPRARLGLAGCRHRRGAGGRLACLSLCQRDADAARRLRRLRARPDHPDPRAGADRHRQPDLGADRGLDRPSPCLDRAGAADRPVPGRLPRQRALPDRRRPDRGAASGAQHLAFAADDPGHPVVHPVQRHRRRQRPAHGPEGGGLDLPRAPLAVVARRSPCPASSPITSPAP